MAESEGIPTNRAELGDDLMLKLVRRQVSASVVLLVPPQMGFAWGHEGHRVIALIAEHYMTGEGKTKAGQLLDGSGIDGVASWADD